MQPKGRLLNDQIVEADAGGVVVVEDDELAIDRAVDIRFHGKVQLFCRMIWLGKTG